MSTQYPAGWGFHSMPKEEFERVSALRRENEDRRRRQTAAAHSAESRKKAIAARRATFRGQDRCMHFQFALWAAAHAIKHDAPPSAKAVRETFGVSATTAYLFLADLKTAADRLKDET
jgi:hypothetical protein